MGWTFCPEGYCERQIRTSALPLGRPGTGVVPLPTRSDGASFILITPGKDFKASQLLFRNHHVPLPSLLRPSGPASTQTYLV